MASGVPALRKSDEQMKFILKIKGFLIFLTKFRCLEARFFLLTRRRQWLTDGEKI
jgi:hypothetical protein